MRYRQNKMAYIILYMIVVGVHFSSSYALATKPNKAHFFFTYEVHIQPTTKQKGSMSIWIPYPVQDEVQTIHHVTVKSPLKWKLTKEKRYGNRMIFIRGNVQPLHLVFRYELSRKASQGRSLHIIKKNPILKPSRYLGPNRLLPNSMLFHQIATQALKKAKDKTQDKRKILYKYIVDTMHYDKSGKGWGHGDPIWACTNKRGNCTDFHSLYIALARSQKIPARFLIGFPIPISRTKAIIKGYHCWTEVFSPKKGWIPLDASEAKKKGKMWEYYHFLPPDRVHFSTGRDIILNPPQKQQPLNYFIYPYVEINGKSFKNIKTTFSFQRKNKTPHRRPL